ncbi:hypothetical protein [Haloprofundus sp. MHR1]|uniref:hypothetical protein n=1 Tax=Haloprofundus sp. MHR1 TaxID=2572921 RepID=UPI0010BF4233|nr:hypothetical protein [Haloprofundus sp. MHR1]QCJ46899.1 hypothetical protein FCF25_07140 [Haloprofundus sp. MHR1]
MTDDSRSSVSRRRTLLGVGALVLGGLGGGIGAQRLFGDPTDDSGTGLDLDVETRDGGRTPTPTPSGADGADGPDSDGDDPGDGDAEAGSDTVEPSDGDRSSDGRDSDRSSRDRDGRTEESSGDGGTDETTDRAHLSLRRVSSEPVRVGNLLPGDSGTASFVVKLRGSEATLTVDGEVSDTDENDRTESERADGDDTASVGELQEYLRVTLWHDTAGRGERTSRDPVVYEGSLAGLSDLDGAALAGGRCVGPGTHRLGVEWALPDTVGNVVQSDSASFGVTVSAEACPDRLLRR